MYKVFFNDRIVFVDPGFNKSLIPGTLYGVIAEAADIRKWWSVFLNDPEGRNLYLTGTGDVWSMFCSYFKTIEAAGGLVFNAEKALLCMERFGKWDLPKGKIEAGETRAEAALREVEEETGLTGLILEKFHATSYHIYAHPKKVNTWVLKPTYWYVMRYHGNETPVPQLTEGIEKVQWIQANEMKRILTNTYASLLALFRLNS
ncbi:MAG: NUDIX domain-containing protein [Prolixibacteraceae bacterium]|nr:NUDIX domain-containing protein [Prolixibacteraceae bacterium]